MIRNAKLIEHVVSNPQPHKVFDLLKQKGPGVFVSAYITKQGGANDMTWIKLLIDGVAVTNITFAAADNFGMDSFNNSGIALVKGVVDCVTIQFNEPLYYEKELRIETNIDSDAGIVALGARVVIGSTCSYPA